MLCGTENERENMQIGTFIYFLAAGFYSPPGVKKNVVYPYLTKKKQRYDNIELITVKKKTGSTVTIHSSLEKTKFIKLKSVIVGYSDSDKLQTDTHLENNVCCASQVDNLVYTVNKGNEYWLQI